VEYQVSFTSRFQAHLKDIGDYIAQDGPTNALRWIEELERQLSKLRKFPERHGAARENDSHDIELRQMLYGRGRNKYRVIFTIRNNEIVVLDIRHGARKELPPSSLD